TLSSPNVKASAQSPVAGMVHSPLVLLWLWSLSPLLVHLLMAAMTALQLVVASNLSEAPKALHLLRTAPRRVLWVFATCFSLTVLLDMVIAITAGILLAAVLFMREVAEMTRVTEITDSRRMTGGTVPEGWSVFRVNGPLFFAAADRVFGELAALIGERRGIILDLEGVSIIDAGGLSALTKLIAQCQRDGCRLRVAGLQFQPLKTLARAGLKPIDGVLSFHPTLVDAVQDLSGNS